MLSKSYICVSVEQMIVLSFVESSNNKANNYTFAKIVGNW